ncbi:MAG: CRTAC1 family protein, partial [Chitinophagaceae bacterium]|nr:CRTAC1 family protein [Chitinophagaceae bacterium]
MFWFRNIYLYILDFCRLPIPSFGGVARSAGVGSVLLLALFSCKEKKQPVLFQALTSERTGLNFSNNLNSSDSFNLFKYMYFYNGAGVGVGDFNNDGNIDVFFASNQGDNSLYLNSGGLHFRNVTKEANIPNDGSWSTGVSVVDINHDGLLDIYVSRVGNYRILKSHNQFLICQGIDKNGVPQYADKAKELGLDFSGFGTQAAFLDFDLDGDLDVFLLNHSVHENGTFRARNEFTGTYHPYAGSKMYRNDKNSFTDITKECGINSTAIGYGLGITVSDINIDGYPDIYIGNDFHENDYLYINQANGKFKDVSGSAMMHTSQFTMGVDAADANNDGYPEIVSMDMLPSDPYILKRSLGEDSYDIFFMKISYGYNYQYTRNNLQFNRRNGNFSEIGLYSGIAATDWSWSPLWMDFDNDGLKDLFVSNGIPKRMNDIDYINYVSDQEIQQKIKNNKMDEKDEILIEKFPQIKIPNKFFKNDGDMRFTEIGNEVGNNMGNYSNGAAFADFDNDGDMDIIVNNIDEDAVIYENKLNENRRSNYLEITLRGPSRNVNAIGSRVVMFSGKEIRTYEKNPVRGFLSSMEVPLHVGLDSVKVDSMFLIWPDNTYQQVFPDTSNKKITIRYKEGLPVFDYSRITSRLSSESENFENITGEVNLAYAHKE